MLAILKKELAWYAGSPMMYAACAVFTGLAGYLFYGNLIMLLLLQGSALRVDLWEFTVNDIRLLVMLFIPVVTMRLIAEERRLGTIELLHTAPLSEWGVVAGKFFAGMSAIGVFVGATLLFPLLFSLYFPLQPAPLIIAYAGIALLCAAICAAGIFFSAVTKSQVVAAVATAGFVFSLWFIDQGEALDRAGLARLAAGLSLQKHFYNFNRGVLSLHDMLYFAGCAAFFILLTVETLKLRTRQHRSIPVPRLGPVPIGWLPFAARMGLSLLVWSLCMFHPAVPGARLDGTPGRVHTPSAAAREAFARLKAPFSLTVGCEGLQRYQYADFFEQLSALSPRFSARLVQLGRNPVAAARLGLEEPGAGIAEYDGRTKKIAQVTEASLVGAVWELTRDASRNVRIIAGAGGTASFAAADAVLAGQGFSLQRTDAAAGSPVDPETQLLIVRSLRTDLPENTLQHIGSFFERGGSVLLLVDGPAMPNLARFLRGYNVDLGNDYILDREHGGAGFDELTPVIFFNKEHPALARCSALAVFNRARSVQVGTRPRAGYTASILCFSGRGTWAEADTAGALAGTASYDSGADRYGPVTAGVGIEKLDTGGGKNAGRMAVMGSGSFMADSHRGLLGNAAFAEALLSWLTAREAPARQAFDAASVPEPVLLRMTEPQSRLFFSALVVLAPLVFLLAGAAVFVTRRLRH